MRKSILCLMLLTIARQCGISTDAKAVRAPKQFLQAGVSTKTEQSHLQFPASYSVGSLQLMGNEESNTQSNSVGLGKAQGMVTVTVPPGGTIMLELNPRCIEHSELLRDLNTKGINRLKLAYLSMDDVDHSLCDRALLALPEFKDLISLHVERSDVTDKGLAGFKSLSSLKYISAFGCALDGSIFKEVPKLKNLRKIDVMYNPLKGVNFKTLGALPNLEELNFNQSHISDDDIKFLPKCPALKKLLLLDNKRITDKSVPVLQQQTTLETLDVRGTAVSVPGTLALKNLKLKTLILSVRRYRPNELEQLQKAFPNAVLNTRGGRLSSDDAAVYAPLK